MSRHPKGTRLRLSPARKMVCEIMHHGQKVPSLPQARACNLAVVASARRAATPSPSWTAIFLKAFGLTALRIAELRRAYVSYPWPYLYEHPCTEAAILVHREWQGENVVLGSRVCEPEKKSLVQIDAFLSWLQATPVPEVPHFRRWLRTGSLPSFVRRFLFWCSINLSGWWRARNLGTCVVSSVGSLGSEQLRPITPLTTYFTTGPIAPNGDTVLNMIYDHRVMDARTVAIALNEIVSVLNTEVLTELKGMTSLRAGAA